MLIYYFTYFLAAIYSYMIISYIRGWIKTKEIKNLPKNNYNTRLTIVIPARNEENNILKTLKDIQQQTYPKKLYELIVVNDNSTDNTQQIVEDFILKNEQFDIKIINLKNQTVKSHKKQAILKAIEISDGEWIVNTDADCRRSKRWLESLADIIETQKYVLVSAPVMFFDEKTIFQKMQSIEFISLIGIGAASIKNKQPNMCNGANLSYYKKSFFEVEGFKNIDKIVSGDDELIMHKIAKKFPEKLVFLKNKDAIVTTKAKKDLKSFINQRVRWVSKSTKYDNKKITLTLSFAYVYHFLIILSLLIGIFNWNWLIICAVLFGVKIILEFTFNCFIVSFFNKKQLLFYYLPAATLYVFYVVFIGMYARLTNFEWKGRVYAKNMCL